MTNDITTAAGLGNCENPNCGKSLKPPYYLVYPLTRFVERYIIAECRTLEDETKNEPKIAELVKVKVHTALGPEHIIVDSSGSEVTIEQYTNEFLEWKKRQFKECLKDWFEMGKRDLR